MWVGAEGFLRDESGAVTVDWVFLTAAVAVMAVLIASIVLTGAMDPVQGLGAVLAGIGITD
jgi:hypothetical protein